mmetsp:Transcript_41703/g.84258  ORF Transcript_41703/g.84258 Transcript_41703/m.84258 type:complete len:104 (-) Transcript_41703:48-359(-)
MEIIKTFVIITNQLFQLAYLTKLMDLLFLERKFLENKKLLFLHRHRHRHRRLPLSHILTANIDLKFLTAKIPLDERHHWNQSIVLLQRLILVAWFMLFNYIVI